MKKKPNGVAEMNIGVLADGTAVLWEYRNVLLEIAESCEFSVNITLSKEVKTCQRVMTFCNVGYDLLIIDSKRYASQEEQLIQFILRKTESIRFLIHRKKSFYVRRFKKHEEEPLKLITGEEQEKLYDVLLQLLTEIYEDESQIIARGGGKVKEKHGKTFQDTGKDKK